MVLHVLDLVGRLRPDRTILVVGTQADEIAKTVTGRSIKAVLQRRPLGTGHAALQAERSLRRSGPLVLILNGDTPLLRKSTLDALIRCHRREKAVVTLLTARLSDPAGYGRIVRDVSGSVVKIVEEKDASPEERNINEVNTGTYVVERSFLFPALHRLRRSNKQGEYYLTDIVGAAVRGALTVSALAGEDPEEVRGINTRADLAAAERTLRLRRLDHWMRAGVTIRDPESTHIGSDVRIGRDTVLHPFSTIEGETRIGRECVVRSHVCIRDSRLADGVTVREACVIEESRLGKGVSVGPFAHLRPGTVLDPGARVGNFVEIKKARLGAGSKANHLSYIGDAAVGRRVNIGAGTITCNYDGAEKHRTVIGDDVFVGSDTQFVAPVRVGKGAVVAAGSTITRDVPPDALAIARTPQSNKPGYAKRRRERIVKKRD